jgi:ElaA protein
MATALHWQSAAFGALSVDALYALLALRQEVFVLEQQCLYNDMDGLDPTAHHLLGWSADGRLAAYLRCLAPGVKFEEASLGRVVTVPHARGTGAGRALVARGIALATELHPAHGIRIGAQAYLEQFYASFGFLAVGEPYDEDGITHIDMVRARVA